jgi:hypothetical protein
MDKKIVLLALLVMLVTATMVTITAGASSEKSLGSVRKCADEKFLDNITSSGRVQLIGDSMGGGWPSTRAFKL